MRRALAGLSLLAAVVPLAACASETEEFCAEVEAQQERLTELLTAGSQDALIRALPSLRALQEKAPSDIRDEYDVVVDTLETLDAALDDAGLDPATYDKEDLAGLPEDQRLRIEAAATAVGARETQVAFDGLEQQARDVCHTPLTL